MSKINLTIKEYLERLEKSLYIPETSQSLQEMQVSLENYRYLKERYQENLRLFAANITKNWLYPKEALEILNYIDPRFFTRVLTYFCFLATVDILKKTKKCVRLEVDKQLRKIIIDLTQQYLSTRKTKKKNYELLTALNILKMHDEFLRNFWTNLISLDFIFISEGGFIKLNEEKAELLFETYLSETFKDYPMIVKPKDWDRFGHNGGYFINKRPFVKTNDAFAGTISFDTRLVRLINHLQGMAWSFDIPEKYLKDEFDIFDEDLKVAEHPAKDIQQRLHIYFFLKNFISKVKTIYYPYNIDFRSRIYSLAASFSPITSKKLRMYIRTENPYILTDSGKNWLKLHIAHMLGIDKKSYKETNDTLNKIENLDEYIKNMPAGYKQYSTLNAYYNIFFERSSRMLQFDATSSVFQILGVLFNSKELMEDSNLLNAFGEEGPNPNSKHIFSDVYDKVLLKAKETSPFPELDLVLKRKFVKPIVMTFAYGSEEWRGRQNITEFLKELENLYLEKPEKNTKFLQFNNISNETLIKYGSPSMAKKFARYIKENKIEDIRSYKKTLYASIFYRHIIQILYGMYPILEDFKENFIKPKSTYQQALFQNPFFEFENIYYKETTYRSYTNALQYNSKGEKQKFPKRVALTFKEINTEKINEKKLAGGANYIHSLDAFILYYILENKPKEYPLLTVHDCILIRSSDVDFFLILINEAYKEIQKIAQKHTFFSKYHINGSIEINSYNIFKMEYGDE